MAIIVDTLNPAGLHKAIMDTVRNGKLTSWEIYTYDNVEFITLSAGPSKKKAYLKPVVVANENKLKLAFYGPGKPVKRAVYADYHGSFIQALLSNFSDSFKFASAGGKAISIDKFTFED
jgi:hypothetical protein